MRAADQQALAGVPVTARAIFRDQDGEVTDPGGTVTATIASAWDQFAQYSVTASADTEGYEADLTSVAEPDLVTVTWQAGARTMTTTVEIVGAYYASVSQMRGSGGEFLDGALSDASKYPTARLLATRRFVEEEFEDFTGRAFVPRCSTFSTRASDRLVVLPHPDVRAIRSLIVDGVSATPPESGLDGAMILDGFNSTARVDVTYEHGMSRPPQAILRAFFTRSRSAINAIITAIPDRASTFSSEGGATYSLLTEGRAGALTAIPSVDLALREWTYRQPVMG